MKHVTTSIYQIIPNSTKIIINTLLFPYVIIFLDLRFIKK